MFERFTDRARRVVVLAQEEARALNHSYIGTEHLLLGLLAEGTGVAAKALASLNVSLEATRRRVEEAVGRGEVAVSGHVPFTPRAKKGLEDSFREARTIRHPSIDTQHLLLGIVDARGVASSVLESVGVSATQVRDAVAEVLAKDSAMKTGRAPTDVEAVEGFIGRRCPSCSRPLEDTAEYHTLEVPSGTGDGQPVTVRIVSCGACGYVLGILPT